MRSLLLVCCVSLLCRAQTAAPSTPESSPTERQIAQAKAEITKDTKNAEAYARLALIYVSRARETASPAVLDEADKAVQQALAITPEEFSALRARVAILLERHEDTAALALAQQLNKRIPDDLNTYGLLARAAMNTGDYTLAEKKCQMMVDLRPPNPESLTCGALLREAFGDREGALDWWQQAYKLSPPEAVEQRAWFLAQGIRVERERGRLDIATSIVKQANMLLPGHVPARREAALVLAAQGQTQEAVTRLTALAAEAHDPALLWEAAKLQRQAGQRESAGALEARFRKEAEAVRHQYDNASVALTFYYADQAHDAARALAVAEEEYARRKNIATRHAYAWALFQNGRAKEAREQLTAALAVGYRDAELSAHARQIQAPTQ